MPATATAAPTERSRNPHLQDQHSALDGPEKKESPDSVSEPPSRDSLAPNPSDGFSMAGNMPAEPVAAVMSRPEPAIGNAPMADTGAAATTAAESSEVTEEATAEEQATEQVVSAADGGARTPGTRAGSG